MAPDIDINPASLARAESAANDNSNVMNGAKLSLSTSSIKAARSVQGRDRVDYEPIYTSLKGAIGDHWPIYKDALTKYVLGLLSQSELTRLIDPFLLQLAPLRNPQNPDQLTLSETIHLHNKLLSAIHKNALCDHPDTPVAPWVSANDKPTTTVKQPSGDVHDQRLRSEVMNLPPRTRFRLKNIADDPATPITTSLSTLAHSKRPHLTTTTDISAAQPAPAGMTLPSAAPAPSLNKDPEIRKRYTQPLASELLDLPTTSAIADRIQPIAFEQGLQNGIAHPAASAELLTAALDMLVKSRLHELLSRTRTNAPVSRPQVAAAEPAAPRGGMDTQVDASNLGVVADLGVCTARFRERVAAEEAAAARGDVKRTEMGLLPVEVAEQRKQGGGRGAPGDLRLSWMLGDSGMGPVAWMGERLMVGELEREGYVDEDADADRDSGFWEGEGERDADGDVKMEDVWAGGARGERGALGDLLDECLAVGGPGS